MRERGRVVRCGPVAFKSSGAFLQLKLPSGREVPLEYRDAGIVAAAVKLQQLFGLADSPRLGPCGSPSR